MATITEVARTRDVSGVRRRYVGQYSGPSSYVAGGDSFVAGEVGMGTIEHASFEVATDGSDFRLLLYDHSTGKVVWIVPDTGAEVAGAVDLSAFNARFEAIGY